MAFRRWSCIAAVLLLAWTAPSEGGENADSAQLAIGRTLYFRYCAACHGRDGRGDGPVSPAIAQPIPDLTAIAARNDGIFPFLAVAAAIDGTREVGAHGVSEMPVWGRVLAPGATPTAEEETAARAEIVLLTEFLRSIQRR
jgi:mono/diheme cytochrome c family protein